MKNVVFYLLIAVGTGSCSLFQEVDSIKGKDEAAVVCFGSCNILSKPQLLWDDIAAESPDAFVWLGDIIYGDTEDMQLLRQKYNRQKAKSEYAELRSKTTIYGIYDDHDYGKNDGGKEYPKKQESRDILFDFLDIPKDAEIRHREGAYQDYLLDLHHIKLHLILLDERYFRDSLLRPDGVYQPNDTGSILGPTQWHWLTETLENSPAELIIIGSGTQVFPFQHRFEKWANFPKERQHFIRLLAGLDKPVIILSGDRHFGELSAYSKFGRYPVFELTSSSLTHTYPVRNEVNKYRIGVPITVNNYGVLRIRKNKNRLEVEFQLKGDQDEILLNHKVYYLR